MRYDFEEVKEPLERLLKRIEHNADLFPERITTYNIHAVAHDHTLEENPEMWVLL